MSLPPIKRSSPLLKFCLFICGAILYGPSPAFTQATNSTPDLIQAAQSISDAPQSSQQAAENPEPPNSPEAPRESACSIHNFVHDTWTETSQFGRGLKSAPRAAIRPSNLKWELPILAATGVLIAKVDRPADNRIQSKPFQQTVGQWSNVGLGLELASSMLAYGIGCGRHHSYLRDTGFRALAAMGAAGAADLALKLAFDRQFPGPGSSGKFWGGGRSFPSGHSATSFAFAAVVAHRYPHKKWVKWSAYALAAGVSLSRYPAKKHYLSDILVGATLGYVTGTYLADR